MRSLCNINVWRRKSGNSMEGFFSHLSCISRIFRPECSFDRKDTMSPCIQVPDFPPRFPGAQGRRNEFCRFVKKLHNQSKTRIPSLAAWARIPGRQVQGGCRTFLYAQRWRLILRGPQYCLARICIRVFVLHDEKAEPLPQNKWHRRGRRISVSSFPIWFGVPQVFDQLLSEEGALRYEIYLCVSREALINSQNRISYVFLSNAAS